MSDVDPKDRNEGNVPIIIHEDVRASELNRPVLPETEGKQKQWELSKQAGLRAAFLCALACVVVFFILIINHKRLQESNPVDNIMLDDLKAQAKANIVQIENTESPEIRKDLEEANEQLFEKIRELDFELRRYYFSLIDLKSPGTFILFIAFVLFFLSLRLYVKHKPAIPAPVPNHEKFKEMEQEKSWGSLAIIGLLATFVVIAIVLTVKERNRPGERYLAYKKQVEASKPKLSYADLLVQNWAYFGTLDYLKRKETTYPNKFEVSKAIWNSSIPMPGSSVPIIWDNKIFISAANKTKRSLYCYDFNSGNRKWTLDAKSDKKKGAPEAFDEYMYAASSPVTNGELVATIFANGDLIVSDMKGSLLWKKDLGIPENHYGHATSPLIYQDKLIVPWDHDGENCGIYFYQLEDGKQVHKIDRKGYEQNWRSPLIRTINGEDTIFFSTDKLTAYRLKDYSKVWEMEGSGGDIGSSPFIDESLYFGLGADDAFVCLDLSELKDGKPVQKWSYDGDGVPDVPSSFILGDKVWLLNSGGLLTCLNKNTGELIYEEDLEEEFYASPIVLGDKLLICSTDGICFVVGTGENYELIHKTEFEMKLLGSPSLYKNKIIFRSESALLCVSN